MAILKSEGITPTERHLAELCERSFLKLWSYPNPCKEDGKELCDLIVVFDNQVLIFFDRESQRLKRGGLDLAVEWPRWRREVVDKQIATAHGAARYLLQGRPIFLDSGREVPFPIPIDRSIARIHKIVVAHGAMEACRAQSPANVSGSLAVSYQPSRMRDTDTPFFVDIDRDNPVHIFDSENLGIILSELDTIFDFTTYLDAKVEALGRHKIINYCGEEDLLAHYLLNYDDKSKSHYIGSFEDFDWVHIGEGEWEDFRKSDVYRRRKQADRNSYLWDRLIQITSENALRDRLGGNSEPFLGKSAIHFMAKEPRFVRRALSDKILAAIEGFPESDAPLVRAVSLMPSFWEGTAYVFLQLKVLEKGDYDTEYRPVRQGMLEIACAAARMRLPTLERVIGIAIDAPRYAGEINSEDLLLMEFSEWDAEREAYYAEANTELRFFATDSMTETNIRITEFPTDPEPVNLKLDSKKRKIGRNELCPCGSGKKYKICCL